MTNTEKVKELLNILLREAERYTPFLDFYKRQHTDYEIRLYIETMRPRYKLTSQLLRRFRAVHAEYLQRFNEHLRQLCEQHQQVFLSPEEQSVVEAYSEISTTPEVLKKVLGKLLDNFTCFERQAIMKLREEENE